MSKTELARLLFGMAITADLAFTGYALIRAVEEGDGLPADDTFTITGILEDENELRGPDERDNG